MKNAYFLRALMAKAWYMVKNYGYTMAAAMRQAWKVAKCVHLMRKDLVFFRYKKADGSTRDACGTLNEKWLAQTKGTGKRVYPHLVTYFDMGKCEYRCFNIANFIGLY